MNADEREGGVRATLNLGHTFGHAMETGQVRQGNAGRGRGPDEEQNGIIKSASSRSLLPVFLSIVAKSHAYHL